MTPTPTACATRICRRLFCTAKGNCRLSTVSPPWPWSAPERASDYGCRAASSIAAGLAAGGCIVISGGSRGDRRSVPSGALAGGGLTIAVQGCGLDVDYPKPNRRLREEILAADGVIVTEYPPGSPPLREHFPVRNRLLAGMAMAVCVVEAPERSGSLITARLARNQGRDVYVVPGKSPPETAAVPTT